MTRVLQRHRQTGGRTTHHNIIALYRASRGKSYSKRSTEIIYGLYQLILVGGDGGEGGFSEHERLHILRLRFFPDMFVINILCSTTRLRQMNARLVFVH